MCFRCFHVHKLGGDYSFFLDSLTFTWNCYKSKMEVDQQRGEFMFQLDFFDSLVRTDLFSSKTECRLIRTHVTNVTYKICRFFATRYQSHRRPQKGIPNTEVFHTEWVYISAYEKYSRTHAAVQCTRRIVRNVIRQHFRFYNHDTPLSWKTSFKFWVLCWNGNQETQVEGKLPPPPGSGGGTLVARA